MSASREPVPFEVYEAGVFLHGTKADLAVGETLVPGRESNFEQGRVMRYVYFTATLDAAVWAADLAAGQGRGRVYIVEPIGEFVDDPNLTGWPRRTVGAVRDRRLAVWVSAAAIGVFQLIGSFGAAHNQPDRRPMDALAVLLVLVGPAALAVRDRWPLVSVAITLASTAIYVGFGYAYGPIFVSVVV